MNTTIRHGQPRASHIPGVMNDLEKDYAAYLQRKLDNGEIRYFKFEAITLKLAPGVTYTPDFFVVNSNYAIEIHEVKGAWKDDARVKLKMAAALFPFIFYAVTQPTPGTWKREVFTTAPATLTKEEAAQVKACDIVNRLHPDQLAAIAADIIRRACVQDPAATAILERAGVNITTETSDPF